jgi:hypothetical protein
MKLYGFVCVTKQFSMKMYGSHRMKNGQLLTLAAVMGPREILNLLAKKIALWLSSAI